MIEEKKYYRKMYKSKHIDDNTCETIVEWKLTTLEELQYVYDISGNVPDYKIEYVSKKEDVINDIKFCENRIAILKHKLNEMEKKS